MDRTRQHDHRPHEPDGRERVSILVAMDRTRQRSPTLRLSSSDMSFNPCCDGSDPSTSRRSARPRASACFNPCCDGSDPSTSPRPPRAEPVITMFQSLLRWIGPVNERPRRRAAVTVRDVSILVAMDRTRQRPAGGDGRPALLTLFQSLLRWIGPVNSGWSDTPSRCRSGFNPCCDGSDPSTLSSPAPAAFAQTVSILVAMDRTRQRPPARSGARRSPWRRLVSILVAMDRTRQRGSRTVRTAGSARFQSLLRWIGPVNSRWRTLSTAAASGVSILVAMDRTRQHRRRRATCDSAGFNPCCDGSDPSTRSVRRRPWRPIPCFNPCCDGSDPSTIASNRHQGCLARFQSLLRWIGPVNTRSSRGTWQTTTRFQSLLRWIGPVNGEAIETAAEIMREFQSLLRWIGPVNSHSWTRAAATRWSFNPCCDGSDPSTWSTSSSTTRPTPACGSRGFNPCCDGSDPSTPRRRPAGPGVCGGFNPCCDGSVPSTNYLDQGGQPDGRVSILVAMDRTRQRDVPYPPLAPLTVFQSLLRWIGPVNAATT